jgi:hypothetical protein
MTEIIYRQHKMPIRLSDIATARTIEQIGQFALFDFQRSVNRILLDTEYRLTNILFYCQRQFDQIQDDIALIVRQHKDAF